MALYIIINATLTVVVAQYLKSKAHFQTLAVETLHFPATLEDSPTAFKLCCQGPSTLNCSL